MNTLFYYGKTTAKYFARCIGVIGIYLVMGHSAFSAESFDHQHSAWTALLKNNIVVLNDGQASQADYASFKKDRKALAAYLKLLSGVTKQRFSDFAIDQQKAFLINAYNAYTIELVLSGYPDIESIKDLGGVFSSPWKKEFVPLLGKTLSLDNIEHDYLRDPGSYDDPRIHFAVNCASIGCPPLREEAFVADRINQQLDEQASRFLSDRSRNRFNEKKNELQISKIFDWYGSDFEKGYRDIHSLESFLSRYATNLSDSTKAQQMIQNKTVDVEFLDYDWQLNDVK